MPKSFYVCKELGKQQARRARRGRRGAENASKRLAWSPSSPSQRQMSPRVQLLLLPVRRRRVDAKLRLNLARRVQGNKQSRKQKLRKHRTQRHQLQVRLLRHLGRPSRLRKPRLQLRHKLLQQEPMLTGSFLALLPPVLGTRELPNRQKSKSRKLPKTKERKMGTSRSSLVILGFLLTSILVFQPRNPPKEPGVQAKKVLSSLSSQKMLLRALRDQRHRAETSPR